MIRACCTAPRGRQGGLVAIVAMLILIGAVVFWLIQARGISGSSSLGAKEQLDSVAALYMAESGAERALGLINQSGITGAGCIAISAGNPTLSVGTGSFTYVDSIPSCPCPADPTTTCTDKIVCATCAGTSCKGCEVTVTGSAGSALRTLSVNLNLPPQDGTSGFDDTVTISIKNRYDVAATAIFNLAWRRQGGTAGETVTGGNANALTCVGACALLWNVESSSGAPSGGSMGSAVFNVPPNTISFPVTQTITDVRNFAEVGAMFPGFDSVSGPGITGRTSAFGLPPAAYWDDGSGGVGTKTVNNAAVTPSVGLVRNGVFGAPNGSCAAPSPDHSFNPTQTCTNWCYGADTLVFGVSARSATFADEVTGVTFNTSGTPSQNVPLIRIAHFPETDGTPPSTGDIYSELWKAYNPNLPNLSADVVNVVASSYSGHATGAIGASFTGSVGGTTLTVSAIPGYPSQVISPGAVGTGDLLASSGGPAPQVAPSTTILSQVLPLESGEALGGLGRYNLSGTAQTVSSRAMTATSKVLHVTACTSGAPCFIAAPGNVLVQNVAHSIQSQLVGIGGQVGDYLVSSYVSPPVASSSNNVKAGSPGIKLYLAVSSGVPAGASPLTRIAKYSGIGILAGNTTFQGVASENSLTRSITLSTAPMQALDLATICAGTCAFFDNPGSSSSTTQFAVTRTAGTDQWAGGFACLKGVDDSKINAIQTSTGYIGKWSEVVK